MQLYTGRLTAEGLFIGGWTAWLVVVLAFPITPVFHGDIVSTSVFMLSNVALYAGLKAIRPSDFEANIPDAIAQIDKALRILVPIALLAFAVRILDYFFLRDVPFLASFKDVRAALEASRPTAASMIFGIISPTILGAGILAVAAIANGQRTWPVLAGLALFFLYPAFSFLLGGRSSLALVIVLAAIAYALTATEFRKNHLVVGGLVGVGAIIVTMVFFALRALESGLPIEERIRLSGYNQLVPLNDWLIGTVRDAPIWLAAPILYILSLAQYLAHGVFEFFLLLKQKSPDDPALLGRYQFVIFEQLHKVFSSFFSAKAIDLEIYNPRSGLYTTMWGPAFIDFKFFMPIFAFLLGFTVSFFRRRVAQGDIAALPLYCLFLFQVAIGIMANGFSWAAAIYANVMFFAAWALINIARMYTPKRDEFNLQKRQPVTLDGKLQARPSIEINGMSAVDRSKLVHGIKIGLFFGFIFLFFGWAMKEYRFTTEIWLGNSSIGSTFESAPLTLEKTRDILKNSYQFDGTGKLGISSPLRIEVSLEQNSILRLRSQEPFALQPRVAHTHRILAEGIIVRLNNLAQKDRIRLDAERSRLRASVSAAEKENLLFRQRMDQVENIVRDLVPQKVIGQSDTNDVRPAVSPTQPTGQQRRQPLSSRTPQSPPLASQRLLETSTIVQVELARLEAARGGAASELLKVILEESLMSLELRAEQWRAPSIAALAIQHAEPLGMSEWARFATGFCAGLLFSAILLGFRAVTKSGPVGRGALLAQS